MKIFGQVSDVSIIRISVLSEQEVTWDTMLMRSCFCPAWRHCCFCKSPHTSCPSEDDWPLNPKWHVFILLWAAFSFFHAYWLYVEIVEYIEWCRNQILAYCLLNTMVDILYTAYFFTFLYHVCHMTSSHCMVKQVFFLIQLCVKCVNINS